MNPSPAHHTRRPRAPLTVTADGFGLIEAMVGLLLLVVGMIGTFKLVDVATPGPRRPARGRGPPP